jgi:arylsulfatase A-like enzyme
LGKGNATIPFNMYEESIRVPLIWNQPGRIQAGQNISAMVCSYDFFPTILDYGVQQISPVRANDSLGPAPLLRCHRSRSPWSQTIPSCRLNTEA